MKSDLKWVVLGALPVLLIELIRLFPLDQTGTFFVSLSLLTLAAASIVLGLVGLLLKRARLLLHVAIGMFLASMITSYLLPFGLQN